MSNVSFQRGEILTAEKLNQLVQGVTGGGASAGIVNGGEIPVQTHQVKQREFSSYVPVRHPVYVDKTSPHWPLAGGIEGWFWRDSATASLTRLPVQPAEGDQLYLNTYLSPWGEVQSQTVASDAAPESGDWNPVTGQAGIASTLLGSVEKDKYKVGTKASTLRFFEAPASPVIPFRLFSVPGAPGTSFGFAAPGTYWQSAPLLDQQRGNAQIISRISSDGGILLRDKYDCTNGGLWYRDIQLIPRLAIAAAPSTDAPLTPTVEQLWTQAAPGTWHEIASTTIAGQKLSLNIQWANPWYAYMNLSATAGGSAALHQTWKKAWGLPGRDAPPGSISVQNNEWRVVSRTSPNINLLIPAMFPASCSWLMQEELILQASGTAPIICADGEVSSTQPILLQAYLRRQLAPSTGPWCVWYDCCWTSQPWLT